MMSNNEVNTTPANAGTQPTLKRVLKLPHLVFYGIAYIIPLAFFETYGLVQQETHGMHSLAFLLTSVAMGFTAFSYSKMVKAYPVAGSVYTYVGKGINPHAGFLSGWLILMDYMLLPMFTYLVMAMYLNQMFPMIPYKIFLLALIALTAYICYRGIEITVRVSSIVVILQIIFIGAIFFFIIRWLAMGFGNACAFDWTAFYNREEFVKDGMGIPMLFSAASLLAMAFLGFDAISTLSEEALRPEKDIGRAIILTCVIMGAFFVVMSFYLTMAWPNAWFEIKDPDVGSYEFMEKVCGPTMAYLFGTAYVFGGFASAVDCQTSAARILFSMGRDHILPPKVFAHIHPKYRTPSYNAIIIAIISLVALFVSLENAAELVNFGALIGFTLVNLSVIAHYYVKEKKRGFYNTMNYLVAPLVGAAFTFSVWCGLGSFAKILGGVWLGIGAVYLVIKTKGFRELPPEMSEDVDLSFYDVDLQAENEKKK